MNLDDDDTVDELPARPRKVIPPADRGLLQLAGLAIGAARVEDVDGEEWLNLHFADGTVLPGWNPLLFYGDTFELAVRLSLLNEDATFQHHLATEQSRGGDPLAVAARAVVLTAAARGSVVSHRN